MDIWQCLITILTPELDDKGVTIPDATDGEDLVATVQGVGTVADSDGYYTKISLVFSVPTTVDYDINAIDAWLVADDQSISTTDLEIESTIGNTLNPLMGSRVEFPRGALKYDSGAPYHEVMDDDSSSVRKTNLPRQFQNHLSRLT